jgi:hypothetical protein
MTAILKQHRRFQCRPAALEANFPKTRSALLVRGMNQLF